MRASQARFSCDSVIAMAARTSSGRAIFAKNSDRMPDDECQPLVHVGAADHEPGAPLRCQYIEIDQVRRTSAVLLSSPYWLWGAEHGVNEHGVAIGNHSIYTKDPLGPTGLLGMDLVRLALERGSDAAASIDVIIELVERYGQGGSGYVDKDWPYHNSFLVADADSAFILEASSRNWAVREVRDSAAGTNHTTIGDDWDRLSGDCVSHAVEQGWWEEPARAPRRFDFAAAYRDSSQIPPQISSGRYRRSSELLAPAAGALDVAAVKRLMRDHYDAGESHRPGRTPDDERFFSICRHDPAGHTTASMVVELCDPRTSPLLCWVAFCNPCLTTYLPVFPAGRVPAALCEGTATRSADSAWWRFKDLLGRVEQDYDRLGPLVREYWQGFETELEESARELGASLGANADAALIAERTTAFMEQMWKQTSGRLDELVERLRALE